MLTFTNMETPIGILTLGADSEALKFLFFPDSEKQADRFKVSRLGDNSVLMLARQQLDEYFSGSRKEFDLPLAAEGTEFQKQVWGVLATIPFGVVRSYQDIANELENPKAVRAVGSANGKNPISVVVPCHRVIGKSGTLTGYAGGLERKAWLLRHEGHFR